MKNNKQLRDRIRAFLKRRFNPLILKLAGASRSPFAIIRHVGRHSGKHYETPIIVRPIADGFLITLTYGPEVDWYRNIVAAGKCTMLWHGREYLLQKPEPIDVRTARLAFAPPLRLILKVLHVEDFVRMKGEAIGPAPDAISPQAKA